LVPELNLGLVVFSNLHPGTLVEAIMYRVFDAFMDGEERDWSSEFLASIKKYNAGMAEMKFGAGKDRLGSVLMVTVGTGIGTVLFTTGKLVTNTELGHIYLKSGIDAEEYASDAVRKKENLDWKEWAQRFDVYLHEMHRLFWPELIIIGGGISKKPENFMSYITVDTEIVMAQSKNEAGIIGAALAARANRKIPGWFF
jgi:polyphosphate glucokinase